jgi:hypothetical protein
VFFLLDPHRQNSSNLRKPSILQCCYFHLVSLPSFLHPNDWWGHPIGVWWPHISNIHIADGVRETRESHPCKPGEMRNQPSVCMA